jgi:hypothetical protein
MEQLVEVVHVNGAWCLKVHGFIEPTLYLSGGRAEHAARQLGRCLAALGCEARVHIHDKQNVLVGDHCYFAS